MLTDDPIQPSAPLSASTRVSRSPVRVQVLFEGHLLADSGDVAVLREAGQEPVYFFPRKDVEMAVLQDSDLRTRSSLGEARHFTIMRDRKIVDDIAWSYAMPSQPELTGRIAFHPDHVEFHETSIPADALGEAASFEPAGSRRDVDAVVRHTDSGSGLSQEEAWEPTVNEPVVPDPNKPYSGVGSI